MGENGNIVQIHLIPIYKIFIFCWQLIFLTNIIEYTRINGKHTPIFFKLSNCRTIKLINCIGSSPATPITDVGMLFKCE